jgi:hypothetical protein
MKRKSLTYLTVIAFVFGMLAVPAYAKKPIQPPPDPEPAVGCAESGSFFPAFVYAFDNQLFLSNAAGDCSLFVYRAAESIGGVPSNIGYRLFEDATAGHFVGKVVWSERLLDTPGKIMLLEFEVQDGVLLNDLPMIPRTLVVEPDNWGNLYAPDLSPDGTRIVASTYEAGEVMGYLVEYEIPQQDEFEGPGEIAFADGQVIFQLAASDTVAGHAAIGRPLYGLRNDRERVYFRFDYPERVFAYVERDPVYGWADYSTDYTVVATRSGGGDLSAVGFWADYREVLARRATVDGFDFVEILDPDACEATIPAGTAADCIVIGQGDGIEAWGAISFTTRTEGSLPALLYLYDVDARNVGYSIRECDPSLAEVSCHVTLYEGVKDPKRTYYGVDSAD